jgi:hypothetical protein
MSENEIAIILALTKKPQKERTMLNKIKLDARYHHGLQENALFNNLEYLELKKGLVLGTATDHLHTARWRLSAKGVKKQAELKKEGWYLG